MLGEAQQKIVITKHSRLLFEMLESHLHERFHEIVHKSHPYVCTYNCH
jgi:hypothetical protein